MSDISSQSLIRDLRHLSTTYGVPGSGRSPVPTLKQDVLSRSTIL